MRAILVNVHLWTHDMDNPEVIVHEFTHVLYNQLTFTPGSWLDCIPHTLSVYTLPGCCFPAVRGLLLKHTHSTRYQRIPATCARAHFDTRQIWTPRPYRRSQNVLQLITGWHRRRRIEMYVRPSKWRADIYQVARSCKSRCWVGTGFRR